MSEKNQNEPVPEQEQPEQKPGFSQEQYEMLKRCSDKGDVKEWNEWQTAHPREPILLQGANLRCAKLQGINLVEARLQRADLTGAKLQGARLGGADLHGAELFGADLREAKLMDANLQETNLSGAELHDADLRRANLGNAYLAGACLPRADLSNARLQRANLGYSELPEADLSGANLQGAILSEADLEVTKLKETDLERADLSGCKYLVFDSTYVLNTRHIPKNDWHRLRNRYTGIRMIFNLVFLGLFISMYGAKAMFWYGVGRGQDAAVERAYALEQFLSARVNAGDPNGLTPEERQAWKHTLAVVSWVSSKLKAEASARLRGAEQAAGAKFRRVKVWQVLISYDRGIWFMLAAVLLIIYNVLRYVLTRRVAALSEEENRSHYTPALKEYKRLLWPDTIIRALWYFAVLSFGIHCCDWLTADVFVPRPANVDTRIDQQSPGTLPASPVPASQFMDVGPAYKHALPEYLPRAAACCPARGSKLTPEAWVWTVLRHQVQFGDAVL